MAMPQREIITTDKAPRSGAYSQADKYGNLV
jgi:hypothetical protein